MNNNRKLTTATSDAPCHHLLFFHNVSRQLRSNLPLRRRKRFSPVLIGEKFLSFSSESREANAKKICSRNGDKGVLAELSDCSCVVSCSEEENSRRNGVLVNEKSNKVDFPGIEDSTKDDKSGISYVSKLSVTGNSDFAGNSVVSVDSVRFDCRGKFGAEILESSSDSVNKLHEGRSDFGGNSVVSVDSVRFDCRGKFVGEIVESASDSVKQNENEKKNCDENDECEVESAVKSDISFVKAEKMKKSGDVLVNLKQNVAVSVDSVENDECEVESAAKSGKSSLKPKKSGTNSVNLNKKDVVSVHSLENVERIFYLECSENFSNKSFENSSQQSHSYSSAYSSIYFDSSELEDDVSDEYTPSTWYESGSQFSEKSMPDACPSHTFQLLVEFGQQFFRSSLLESSKHKLNAKDYSIEDLSLLGLEDEEQEESYRMLRSRERRQMYLRDYAAEYCTTYNGQLIIEQRLEMVHWIFEHSSYMKLHNETMFLGINLLDRFFSKGYFKTKRSLQIAGIACLTLATRIEENQPYNSIREKTFYVGNTTYTRCEVVAMEWLVQEVLSFQCFLPTMYNFLWFYLKAVKASDAVGKTVRYLATLAMLGHEQMCYWPSTVAASLVIIACKAAETDAHCHLLVESHSRVKDDALSECIKRLEWLVKYC